MEEYKNRTGLALIFALFLVLTLLNSAKATTFGTMDGYICRIDEYGETIVRYNGTESQITLPSVASIGADAFLDNTSITSVVIPYGVTAIGEGAFSGCSNLTSVTLPESITEIGNNAFRYCGSLKTVSLPDGLTGIGAGTFSGCYFLRSITFPDSIDTIGDFAFQHCRNLTSITIPEGVTSVGKEAFFQCSGLTSLTLPESLVNIGDLAFYGCYNLQSVNIPENITSIGRWAFGDTPFRMQNPQMEKILSDYIEELNIVPADYPNVFNMIYQTFPDDGFFGISNSGVCFLIANIMGTETVLPIRMGVYHVDHQGNPIDIMNPMFCPYQKRKEHDRIPLVKTGMRDPLFSVDLNSGDILVSEFFTPDFMDSMTIGIELNDNNDKFFFGNDEYFSNNEYITIINSWASFDDVADYFSIDLNELDLSPDFINELNSGYMTLTTKQFLELYVKMIPQENWPVITQSKININNTLPVFKDEILDKEVNWNNLGFCIFRDNKPTIDTNRILLLDITVENQRSTNFDYYTGELMYGYGKKENDTFLRKLDIEDDQRENIRFFTMTTDTSIPSLIDLVPELMDEFMLIRTHRDLVDWYQKIPLDMQIDYSFYDFSKSPIVDEYDSAWLANAPTPTPTPTPPPYAELILGSRGQKVLDMKGRFLELGYYRTDKYNDRFTENTADTVKLFEKNNGLPVDGVADSVMLGVLFSDSAVGK